MSRFDNPGTRALTTALLGLVLVWLGLRKLGIADITTAHLAKYLIIPVGVVVVVASVWHLVTWYVRNE